MEAIAFPDGTVFSIERVELLGQSTSMIDQECFNYTNPAGPRRMIIKIERIEHSLLLIMPVANVPREIEGTLTRDDGILWTVIKHCELREGRLCCSATGVRDIYPG